MRTSQAGRPIRARARVRGVLASFRAWRDRPQSDRQKGEAALPRRIRTIHAVSHGPYGAPRTQAERRAGGMRAGRKRVARLMREARIAGIGRRRRAVATTIRAPERGAGTSLGRRSRAPELHRRRPRQALGRPHHLRPDRGGPSPPRRRPRRRPRRLVEADRRSGVRPRPEGPRRARRPRHGDRGPHAEGRRASQRQGQPAHVPGARPPPAGRPASGHPPAPQATRSTTPWARASSPRLSANRSTRTASPAARRRRSPCSGSSRARTRRLHNPSRRRSSIGSRSPARLEAAHQPAHAQTAMTPPANRPPKRVASDPQSPVSAHETDRGFS